MKRMGVRELVPGQCLDESLFDQKGSLLLAVGKQLTQDMLEGLRQTGVQYVFLGAPPEQVVGMLSPEPISTQQLAAEVDQADALAAELGAAVEEALAGLDNLTVMPEGTPLAETVNPQIQTERPREAFERWDALGGRMSNLVDTIVGGEIDKERAAEQVGTLVDETLHAFADDFSLALNYLNNQGASDYLCNHSVSVCILSIGIANALGYSETQVREIGIAALLQDVGMAMVPAAVVAAPRKLRPDEFVDVQKHANYSLYAIQKMRGLPLTTKFVAYQCHERTDGSGYPKRRGRDIIHRYAKIVSIADAYDALTSVRPWRKAFHSYRAMEFIVREAGGERFCRKCARGLLECLSLYPLGSIVRLTSGEVARVVQSNREAIDRPVVAALSCARGSPVTSPTHIDLAAEPERAVESVIESATRTDWRLGL
jgi:HD-GYP domain-containing protein (c-di-GMP phosphodiesterase class II)